MAVLVPELAARMLLKLYVEVEVVVDDKSELTEDVELMASTCIPGRRHRVHAYPLDPVHGTGDPRVGGEPAENALMVRLIDGEGGWRLATPPPVLLRLMC
jgi:hypothetical protein